jgi:hypothetical protein
MIYRLIFKEHELNWKDVKRCALENDLSIKQLIIKLLKEKIEEKEG